MPNDIHLSLAYLGKTQVRRIGDGLKSNPCDAGPGWYVRAYSNDGYTDIVKHTRITGADALLVARALDAALPRAPGTARKVQNAVQAVLTDLERTREGRRRAIKERIAAAQADLAALDDEA